MISNICFKKRLTQSVNKTDYLKLSWVVQNLSLLYTERERDIRSQMCRWVDKRYSELDFGQISKQTFTECLSGVGTLSTKLRVNLLLWLFWLRPRIWPAMWNSSNIKKGSMRRYKAITNFLRQILFRYSEQRFETDSCNLSFIYFYE